MSIMYSIWRNKSTYLLFGNNNVFPIKRTNTIPKMFNYLMVGTNDSPREKLYICLKNDKQTEAPPGKVRPKPTCLQNDKNNLKVTGKEISK